MDVPVLSLFSQFSRQTRHVVSQFAQFLSIQLVPGPTVFEPLYLLSFGADDKVVHVHRSHFAVQDINSIDVQLAQRI